MQIWAAIPLFVLGFTGFVFGLARQVKTKVFWGFLAVFLPLLVLGLAVQAVLAPGFASDRVGWPLYGLGAVFACASLASRGKPLDVINLRDRENFGWTDKFGAYPSVRAARRAQLSFVLLLVLVVLVGYAAFN